MHFNMNQMMETIISGQEQECSANTTELLHAIVDKTKLVRNCIVYDKAGDLEEDDIDFDSILQMVGDWTGYEAGCNELRIPKQSIPPDQYLALTEGLGRMLSDKYGGRDCAVYLSLMEEEIDLRFHTIRENEVLWLDENLDNYDCPILCWIQE
ncbi:MAG: hypothetical protein K2N87_12370 [Eubacterium sp.]|nr:hypothetical protein [Eubacterium sp.]